MVDQHKMKPVGVFFLIEVSALNFLQCFDTVEWVCQEEDLACKETCSTYAYRFCIAKCFMSSYRTAS